MMDGDYIHSSPKVSNYGRISKRDFHTAPSKLSFSGNFTQQHRLFDIDSSSLRASMRQGILDAVIHRTESRMAEKEDAYEDPRDVIQRDPGERPPKPPRKRNVQGVAVTSPRAAKDGRALLKEQKRKLTKKYESLIVTLMERCEENVVAISEKDAQIQKLKEKLKNVLEYNKQFAEENDQLKAQHETLVKYIEECKTVIKEQRDANKDLDLKNRELEDRVKKYEVPDRDSGPPTAIPLVEVCMSCSSRQILLQQARDQNTRLQRDMQAMKDVLYRLNVQLSRYQERVRSSGPLVADGRTDVLRPGDKGDGIDSLITASLGYRGPEGTTEDGVSTKSTAEEHAHSSRVVDLSGLLSAQALAPLFDAYQENLQEKDSLIMDYEKQFEQINKKSKQIVEENKTLTEKLSVTEEDLVRVRQTYKKLCVEKETADIEKITLVERAERAEFKLKEVYELYEDKMSAMMRDYETVHREYFTLRALLDASQGKVASLAAATVPATMHERSLDHCKRLLEELKHQYGMERERSAEQVTKLQEQLAALRDKHSKMCEQHDTMVAELRTAQKNAKLYRKAAVIFRSRAHSARAQVSRARRARRLQHEPLRQALDALDKIKQEIKLVKSRAQESLEELERRVCREAGAHRRELARAQSALRHKEAVIRSLASNVADVEEVRLSQVNTHRLQGIISDTSPDQSVTPQDLIRKEEKGTIKLVPGPGGYFQERDSKRKGKG